MDAGRGRRTGHEGSAGARGCAGGGQVGMAMAESIHRRRLRRRPVLLTVGTSL